MLTQALSLIPILSVAAAAFGQYVANMSLSTDDDTHMYVHRAVTDALMTSIALMGIVGLLCGGDLESTIATVIIAIISRIIVLRVDKSATADRKLSTGILSLPLATAFGLLVHGLISTITI